MIRIKGKSRRFKLSVIEASIRDPRTARQYDGIAMRKRANLPYIEHLLEGNVVIGVDLTRYPRRRMTLHLPCVVDTYLYMSHATIGNDRQTLRRYVTVLSSYGTFSSALDVLLMVTTVPNNSHL